MITPIEERWAKHVYHMYVIRTEKRDALQEFLKKNGISTGIHYPVPIHKQPAVSGIVDSNLTLKNTEESAVTVLSLPMHPQLTQPEIEYVCEKIAFFYGKRH